MRRGDWGVAWAVSDAALAARTAPADDPRIPYHLRHVWDGRPFDRREVLVRCYHGLGDTLQFLRYLPPLRVRARSVILEVQPELAEIVARMPGIDHLVVFDVAAPLPSREVNIEIMELFHALRIAPEEVAPPYLSMKTEPRSGIGVCGEAGSWDAERSIPAGVLRAAMPGEAVSLHGATVTDTALLIAGVKAVVSVDTMVAHLAGAMGCTVHVLLKARADWRWGEGPGCAWYPMARLYRQAQAGEWDVPLAILKRALNGDLPGAAGA